MYSLLSFSALCPVVLEMNLFTFYLSLVPFMLFVFTVCSFLINGSLLVIDNHWLHHLSSLDCDPVIVGFLFHNFFLRTENILYAVKINLVFLKCFFYCNYKNELQGVHVISLNILWYFPVEREEEAQKWNCDPKDPALLTIRFFCLTESTSTVFLS